MNPRSCGLVSCLLVLGALTGCRPKEETVPPAQTEEQPAPVSAEIVRIQNQMAGDRACYLTVEDEQGRSRDEMASFELCERTDLAGRRARLHFSKAQVMAESCQGNPDCPDTETVDIVDAIELL